MSDQNAASREDVIAALIVAAGLPAPEAVTLGLGAPSVAVAFRLHGVIHTIEGCGRSEGELADDVCRQLRELLK
jgi:hypothetical protein